MENSKEYFAVDDVFCCLGITIKKAKTQETMYKIDVIYPYTIVARAHEMGAIGADARSKVFYSRIKGELEMKGRDLPFKRVLFFHPSLSKIHFISRSGGTGCGRASSHLSCRRSNACNVVICKLFCKLPFE